MVVGGVVVDGVVGEDGGVVVGEDGEDGGEDGGG